MGIVATLHRFTEHRHIKALLQPKWINKWKKGGQAVDKTLTRLPCTDFKNRQTRAAVSCCSRPCVTAWRYGALGGLTGSLLSPHPRVHPPVSQPYTRCIITLCFPARRLNLCRRRSKLVLFCCIHSCLFSSLKSLRASLRFQAYKRVHNNAAFSATVADRDCAAAD